MDIQKEREAFEAWYCRNHTGLKQSDLAKFRTLSGYSFSDSLKINVSWEAWQAAKAQAAPEAISIGNELQSWVAVNSFSADDGEGVLPVVDANAIAEKIEELKGANQ